MNPPIERKRLYFGVCAALLALLALSVALSFCDLGALSLPVALGIAAAKAMLVALFFMHLRFEAPLTRLFAAAGILWLAIMMLFTLADVLTRGWIVGAAG